MRVARISLAVVLFVAPVFAADVRVLEPATRRYGGALSFIESGRQPEAACVQVGMVVVRGAAFSRRTIDNMKNRALAMGADTLVIKDTTIGALGPGYVIRMGAYRCPNRPAAARVASR